MFAESIRLAQVSGCLEAMLSSHVMPPWMQMIAWAMPITYALDALRARHAEGPLGVHGRDIAGMLTLMAAVILPLSVSLFSAAVQRGRREGT